MNTNSKKAPIVLSGPFCVLKEQHQQLFSNWIILAEMLFNNRYLILHVISEESQETSEKTRRYISVCVAAVKLRSFCV